MIVMYIELGLAVITNAIFYYLGWAWKSQTINENNNSQQNSQYSEISLFDEEATADSSEIVNSTIGRPQEMKQAIKQLNEYKQKERRQAAEINSLKAQLDNKYKRRPSKQNSNNKSEIMSDKEFFNLLDETNSKINAPYISDDQLLLL